MGNASFERIEKRLRTRKQPLVIGSKYTHKYDGGRIRKIETIINTVESLGKPKDLAELIYRMVVRKEATCSVQKNGGLKMQCHDGAFRSIEDIFSVTITYYPRVSYKRIYDSIVLLRTPDQSNGGFRDAILRYQFCNDVRREVHFSGGLTTSEETIRIRLGDKNIKFKK